jgi:hypothetical protein
MEWLNDCIYSTFTENVFSHLPCRVLSVVLALCLVNAVQGKKTPSEALASTKKPVEAIDASDVKLEKLETEEDAKKLHESKSHLLNLPLRQ